MRDKLSVPKQYKETLGERIRTAENKHFLMNKELLDYQVEGTFDETAPP